MVKFLKSFLGFFIAILFVLIMIAPSYMFVFLGGLISRWFFLGLLISLPYFGVFLMFFLKRFDWLYNLIMAPINE